MRFQIKGPFVVLHINGILDHSQDRKALARCH